MVKSWYRSFKWKTNPFFVKSNPDLVGAEKEQEFLRNHLDSGNMCFIYGRSGIGKTSLLRWAELKVKGTSVYIDCEGINDDFDLGGYVKTHRSMWRGLFGSYPKDVILLVDEAQASKPELRNAVKLLWESGKVKSAVFSQTETIGNMSKALKNRIGDRIIEIKEMKKEDALNMIELRTKTKNPFEKDAVLRIAEKSNYVPRKILENCEKVCIAMSKRGGKKIHINLEDVNDILGRTRTMVENALGANLIEIKEKKQEIKKIVKKKLSPMQANIVNLLKDSGRTAKELADSLDTSEGSVGKQLSKLGSMGKVKVLSQKRPKVYGLSE